MRPMATPQLGNGGPHRRPKIPAQVTLTRATSILDILNQIELEGLFY
jgi:hypothetical protein